MAYQVSASYEYSWGKTLEIELSLISYQEDGVDVIYSPTLDLFGYGKTVEEAKDSFEVTLQEFVRYTTNKKTLVAELQKLGWKITGRRKRNLAAPDLNELLRDNEMLQFQFQYGAIRSRLWQQVKIALLLYISTFSSEKVEVLQTLIRRCAII